MQMRAFSGQDPLDVRFQDQRASSESGPRQLLGVLTRPEANIPDVSHLYETNHTLGYVHDICPQSISAAAGAVATVRLLSVLTLSNEKLNAHESKDVVSRALNVYHSVAVLSSEQLLIPNIVLVGRVPPGNGTLALDKSSCPANFRVWPEFHNGVAAGLRLPRASTEKNERTITRTWIKFNRPSPIPEPTGNNNERQTPPPSYAHGGFLMALGLRGYLSALTT